MKFFTFSSLGLGALLFGVVQSPASAIIIDSFTAPNTPDYQLVSGNSVGDYSNTRTGLSNVIGENRFMRLDILEKNAPPFAGANFSVYSGTATLSTEDNVRARATFIWNGGSSLGGANLRAGGHNSFNLRVNSIDRPVTLNFKVTDTNDNVGTILKSITNPGEYLFNYDQTLGVNYSSAKSIELFTSNEPSSLDFNFDLVETAYDPTAVPFEFSPALGVLLSGGFFGFTFLKKKFQKKIEI